MIHHEITATEGNVKGRKRNEMAKKREGTANERKCVGNDMSHRGKAKGWTHKWNDIQHDGKAKGRKRN